MAQDDAWYESETRDRRRYVRLGGRWTLDAVPALKRRFDAKESSSDLPVTVDLSGLTALDSAGAWLIERQRRHWAGRHGAVTVEGLAPDFAPLYERVAESTDRTPPPLEPRNLLLDFVQGTGAATLGVGREGRALLSFLGVTIVTMGRVAVRPGRLRFTSMVYHLQQVGLNAMPIVGLITFLVGVVLGYQGVDQLRQFGAEIFTVNLVGISVLREMGILLTAIMVAGRSGSAFTAQIGTMQVNEEVDAIRTLGLDPIEVLVLPRIYALLIALPLLTFFADIMGLLGGGVMAILLIDLSPAQFVHQLKEAVTLWSFWVGMIKAPVFGFLIGLVGCYQGLMVTGSAESVGRRTTQAVVEGIFLVIVFDAVFSIFFSYVGV
ncbi:MAG: MlaE family lipid ABC transporter permease subunit [Rhodospirillaceae bacterium]|nr:MlaE family lipid ABC transporter permease subunit [Rhodospirillaceae bacterium]